MAIIVKYVYILRSHWQNRLKWMIIISAQCDSLQSWAYLKMFIQTALVFLTLGGRHGTAFTRHTSDWTASGKPTGPAARLHPHSVVPVVPVYRDHLSM